MILRTGRRLRGDIWGKEEGSSWLMRLRSW